MKNSDKLVTKGRLIFGPPEEHCSAAATVVMGIPLGIIPILQLERYAGPFLKGPRYIDVILRRGSPKRSFEQALRIEYEDAKMARSSWSLYAENRGWDDTLEKDQLGGMIIRYVKWDRQSDWDAIRVKKKTQRDWPNMKIANQYLPKKNINKLLPPLRSLDRFLAHGIALHDRDISKAQWGGREIMRLFDWGQVHATWCQAVGNDQIEHHMDALNNELTVILTQQLFKNVLCMELNYLVPPIVQCATEGSIVQGSDLPHDVFSMTSGNRSWPLVWKK